MARFIPMQRPSAFRKLAAAAWPAPKDPTILGMVDIEASALNAFIAAYDRRFATALTPTHLVGRAIGLLLARHPEVNAAVGLTGLKLRQDADVFFMIDSEDGRNLSGLKVEAADGVSLAQIAGELRGVAGAIRGGDDAAHGKAHDRLRRTPFFLIRPLSRLTTFLANRLGIDLSPGGPVPDPFGGAIVTSLAKFGFETGFAALPVFGQTGIVIAVMQRREMPWVVGAKVEPRPVLRLCCTTDHRIIDGYSGGLILSELKALLSTPERLLTAEEAAGWSLTDIAAQ